MKPLKAKTMSESLHDSVKIGIVSISDRASAGIYEDKGVPALKDWLVRALKNPIEFVEKLIPDEQALISQTLIELADARCALVLTTALPATHAFAQRGGQQSDEDKAEADAAPMMRI